VEIQTIQSKIFEIRGHKVMLDYDLAALYETETKVLKQAVRRNPDRFPQDFMFELTEKEIVILRSQFVTSSSGWGGRRYKPFAFTEQGVAMLASILNSPKAIEVNIAIVRAFVFIRQYALSHKDLTDKLRKLEVKYNRKFKDISAAIHYLLQKDQLETVQKERKRIGFKTESKK
jgi:ORF6N domain